MSYKVVELLAEVCYFRNNIGHNVLNVVYLIVCSHVKMCTIMAQIINSCITVIIVHYIKFLCHTHKY